MVKIKPNSVVLRNIREKHITMEFKIRKSLLRFCASIIGRQVTVKLDSDGEIDDISTLE